MAPRVFPSRALPWRSVSSCRHSCSSASGPVESRSTAGVARSPAPREPRAPASDPTASAARKASQRRRASGAAEARQRRRDKHRLGVRRATKRSMWSEIRCQAPALRAMWACCADSSSDEDDHNTSNTLLLLFADAFVAPAPLADLSEVDELTVALSCRFALDILTIAQRDRPRPPWMRPLVLRHGLAQASGLQHGWTCAFVAFLTLPLGLLEVPLSLSDPGSLAS